MSQKLILVTDMGIDGAFAATVALYDSRFDVLALCASAGNIPAEQATRNVQIFVENVDPPKWPRVGEAVPVKFTLDARELHGPTGFGHAEFQCAQLHHHHPADKLLVDLVHQEPAEVTLVVLGPCTTVARALDRDGEFQRLVKQMVIVGGTWHEPGDAGPVSEFHFTCDPEAARQVLRASVPITVLPLDVTRHALFSPTELADLPCGQSRGCRFLRRIAPFGVQASAQHLGIEGFFLRDLLGIVFLAVPQAFKTRPVHVDVETRGELTRGMSVVDERRHHGKPNAQWAYDVDMKLVRSYLADVLSRFKDED
ncbi:MAG: nucleoside hydrolase [Gemmatales bacterium]|nr:nucleoside hydrolase [Gemmatales bacterium]MDW8385464.1 nucleoside hydrolase [Gemmatales bacterium]